MKVFRSGRVFDRLTAATDFVRMKPVRVSAFLIAAVMLYTPSMQSPYTETRNLKPAIWIFAGGLLATWVAVSEMRKPQWAYLVFGAKLCDISILISGILLLAARSLSEY